MHKNQLEYFSVPILLVREQKLKGDCAKKAKTCGFFCVEINYPLWGSSKYLYLFTAEHALSGV